jgi:hypothetical protein
MKPPNFDRVSRLYRWAEYATLGPALTRCRNHHLARAARQSQALILGDGDGRFTARLLAANPSLQANAVDSSAAMLALLRARCGPTPRLQTHHADALTVSPPQTPDLIVAHFFFDCFAQPQLDLLIERLAAQSQPDTLWLVSDFRIPTGLLHWPYRVYIRALYLAFRILTGLRVTRLPDHATPLRAAGLAPIAIHRSLFGLLTTELWRLPRNL